MTDLDSGAARAQLQAMSSLGRRPFLGAGVAMAVASGASLVRAKDADKEKAAGDAEEISPTEDLMREHGLLNRVLIIYDEGLRRIAASETLPVDHIHHGATIIKRFIESYHEKLEEEQLFPRFEKAGKMTDLVAVLRQQHDAGRRLTAEILKLKEPARLVEPLRRFAWMYRPHEAREDTVLFPAFRELVGAKELARLGDVFEEREHKLFGERGFEKMVDEVAAIEKALGIGDLGAFTPKT
jgi:hemerythrin-like domain-containing protein